MVVVVNFEILFNSKRPKTVFLYPRLGVVSGKKHETIFWLVFFQTDTRPIIASGGKQAITHVVVPDAGICSFVVNFTPQKQKLNMNALFSIRSIHFKKSIYTLSLLALSGLANAQFISTVAGGSNAANIGDGLPALQAGLNIPTGFCRDSHGNIYLAERNNNRIRKIDATTGTVSTVAGTGYTYFISNNIPATAAMLYTPASVLADKNNNIYICESGNHAIRKVSAATGLITTIAGTGIWGFAGDNGLATAARLFNPRWICFDTAGNLLIADANNHRIRKVDIATGIITTIVGNGTANYAGDGGLATAASINSPSSIYVDKTNNLYIADANNHRIRKVTMSTGIITTIAGTGAQGYTGDGGPATAATFTAPISVNGDTLGNLYLTSAASAVVRKINTSGTISTIAGRSFSGFSGDGGAATLATLGAAPLVFVDSGHIVLVADPFNQRIRRINPADNRINTIIGAGPSPSGDDGPATDARLYNPTGLCFFKNNNMIITERHRIRLVEANSGYITTLVGDGTPGFSGDGGMASMARITGALFSCIDTAGNILIADAANARIRKVDTATGIITTIAGNGISSFAGDNGPAINASLFALIGICTDAANNIYISGGNRIRKINAATGIITTIAGDGTAGFSAVSGPAISAKLNIPWGLCTDNNNNLYIADRQNYAIRKIDLSTGIISTVAGTGTAGNSGDGGPANLARIAQPYGISVDRLGNLYIMDQSNNRIRKVDWLTGNISTVAGGSSLGYFGDNFNAIGAWIQGNGIAIDTAQQLYMADAVYNNVRKVTRAPLYIFTGNGSWDNPANWWRNEVPPFTLTDKLEVVIDPVPGGEAVLERPQQTNNGARIVVKTGKKLRINGNLTIGN
jgi:trimeric autotransporter adhesin